MTYLKPSDFTGRWRADVRRSQFATPAPVSLEMLIDHSGDTLRAKVMSLPADGVEQAALFTCRTTGEAGTGRLNGQPVAARAWWLGEELLIETIRPGDGLRLVDRWRLSDDRRTLTMAHRDDALAGQTVLLERVE